MNGQDRIERPSTLSTTARRSTERSIGKVIPSFAIALAVGLGVAACQTNGSTCDGWERIPLKPATAVWLVGHDRPAAEGIAGHNEFGKRKCGWK